MIVGAAAALRLVSALFSRGYAMHDDHFCVIEVAQRWVAGHNDWFASGAYLRSVVYPGLHYLLFRFCDGVGLLNPQAKMLLVRILHAAYSLLTVVFGYRLAYRLANEATAKRAGMLCAAFWLFPFLSVRNLSEFVCIPPLVIGLWFLHRPEEKEGEESPVLSFLWAGICFGLAFIFRFHTIIMAGAVGLVLVARKQWRYALLFGLGWLISGFGIQGISDWFAYGYPFASAVEYFKYNSVSAQKYVIGPWYQYLLLLFGIFIPPLSIAVLFGWLKIWKTYPLLFWPTFAYLAFHSFYPGKQERFILPIVPLILISGLVGWDRSPVCANLRARYHGLIKGAWVWFWAVNTLLLMLFTGTYVKKVRCETLSVIWRHHDATAVIIEGNSSQITLAPRFYTGTEVPVYYLTDRDSVDSLAREISRSPAGAPNYAVCIGNESMPARTDRLGRWGDLELVETIRPALLDGILHAVNPRHNKNYTSRVYRLTPR